MTHHFHRLLRWLLFLWVKVEVFPREQPPCGLDPAKATLYVLADRGLSDLLVLTQITHELGLTSPLQHLSEPALASYHSVYSIASRNPLIDWLNQRKKQPTLLLDFLQALDQHPDLNIQVVPVSVYWGRPLAKQKHWLQVLFADTWVLGGRSRKFFTILFHGRNTRLLFSQPLSFSAIARESRFQADALHEHLLLQLTNQREATFGPQITSRKTLINDVMESKAIQQLIATHDDKGSPSAILISNRARRYCGEIFADSTQMTIELMLRLLRFFWRRYYGGIDSYNIETVKEIALTHQLVYVPCHRSHVDYLLLSYVIYNENLAIPYIAAGNNLNLPIIGRILRGGGAFFMRRSFRDNPLYAAVLRTYIERLVALGVPLEYFIEGGRSRTGRLLKPKLGLLDMTVEAFMKTRLRPLAFIPVYIGYEKLLEGSSYVGELYGAKKQHESLFGTLGAIFRLKGHFGKVTASFGKPIILTELLDQEYPDWSERIEEIDQKPGWYRRLNASLAQKICHEINRACVINPVNLIATVLLATPHQSIDIRELIAQSNLYIRLIQSIPALASLNIPQAVDRQQIARCAQQKLLHIREHALGDIAYLKTRDSVLISYYRNNSLHSLIIPALIACCFVNTRQTTQTKMLQTIRLLYPFLKSELQLEWDDKQLEILVKEFVSVLVTEQLLIQRPKFLRRPDRSNRSYIILIRLAHIVRPILERYYMTFIVLWQSTESPVKETELELHCHLLAQKISMLSGINTPDFSDRLLFRHFIETMIDLNYLERNEQDALVFTDTFELVNLDIRNLIDAELRNNILTLIRQ